MQKSLIALTTPTGNIGSKVLSRLVKNKTSSVRVLARDPEKLHTAISDRVEIIKGSMDNPSDLRLLLDGASALFWCQPDSPAAQDYTGAYEALARRCAAALHSSAVTHVVAVSAAGEPGGIPAGPITALHRMEDILTGTGAAMRFLRCGSFFENLLWQWDQILQQRYFTYPAPGNVPGPQVATADIADAAVRLLENPQWSGRDHVHLLGPRDLTYDEMAETLSNALDTSVSYEASPPAAYKAALVASGQSESAAQGLVDMFSYLTNHYTTPLRVDRSLSPTTFDAWLNRG